MLILTKPLGVGVMTTALKKGLLPPEGYDEVRADRDRVCVAVRRTSAPHRLQPPWAQ